MKKTMKLKFIIAAISALFSTALFAQWQPVGNAEYRSEERRVGKEC